MSWLPLFSNPGAAGFSEVNLGDADAQGGFLNALDGGSGIFFDQGAVPTQLDDNGIPKATLTGSQKIIYNLYFANAQTGPAEQWVFKWTPAGGAVVNLNGWPITQVSISGGSYSSGQITMSAGTPCRFVFTWNTLPDNFPYQFQFLAAAYAPTSSKPVLCRVSDEAAITAGQYVTAEFLASYRGLNLKTIRMMPWTFPAAYNVGDNLADWSYRTPVTAIGWGTPRYYPGLYAGTASGTDFYTVSPGASTSLTDWTDGETIQATIANNSTLSYTISNAVSNGGLIRLTLSTTTGMSTGQKIYISGVNGTLEANGLWTITVINGTTIDLQSSTFTNTYSSGGSISVQTLTVTGKTNGTKIIAAFNASAGSTVTAAMGTFVYNRTLDVLLWRADAGIMSGYPLEVMIDVVNRLNVNLWYTVPMMANDSFVTSMVAFFRDRLNSSLCLYLEYANETWNFSSPQFTYTYTLGQYFQIGGNLGYTGVRAAMIFTAAKATWASGGRSAATLRCALMWQAYGSSAVQYYVMNATEAAPTNNQRLCTYLGGTFSGTCSGSPNFSTTGNRPIDLANVGGYAIYTQGIVIKAFGYNTGNPSEVTPYVISTLQTMATLFNSGTAPDQATAFAMIDEDLRQGVFTKGTISSVSTTTINATSNGRAVGDQVVFYTTGTLPSPLVTGKIYYVTAAATNTFSVSATYGGSAISLSGGSGTQSFGFVANSSNGNESLIELATTIMQNTTSSPYFSPGWEGVVASYDAYRSGAGLAPLRVELYEGGLQGAMPTAVECAAMGITIGGSSTTAAAVLAAGFEAYKNSSYGSAFSLSLFKLFMGTEAGGATFGTMAHSKTPSWFLNEGGGKWALIPGPFGTAPYQTYNGVAAFTGVSN